MTSRGSRILWSFLWTTPYSILLFKWRYKLWNKRQTILRLPHGLNFTIFNAPKKSKKPLLNRKKSFIFSTTDFQANPWSFLTDWNLIRSQPLRRRPRQPPFSIVRRAFLTSSTSSVTGRIPLLASERPPSIRPTSSRRSSTSFRIFWDLNVSCI